MGASVGLSMTGAAVGLSVTGAFDCNVLGLAIGDFVGDAERLGVGGEVGILVDIAGAVEEGLARVGWPVGAAEELAL